MSPLCAPALSVVYFHIFLHSDFLYSKHNKGIKIDVDEYQHRLNFHGSDLKY